MSENYSDYDISGLGFGPQEESRVMAPLTQRFLGLPEEALSLIHLCEIKALLMLS